VTSFRRPRSPNEHEATARYPMVGSLGRGSSHDHISAAAFAERACGARPGSSALRRTGSLSETVTPARRPLFESKG
jgi:hypothetical protein